MHLRVVVYSMMCFTKNTSYDCMRFDYVPAQKFSGLSQRCGQWPSHQHSSGTHIMAGIGLYLQKPILSYQRHLQRSGGYADGGGIYLCGADVCCVFAAGGIDDVIPQDVQKVCGSVCFPAGIDERGSPVCYRVPFVEGKSCKRAGSR